MKCIINIVFSKYKLLSPYCAYLMSLSEGRVFFPIKFLLSLYWTMVPNFFL